MQRHAQLLIEGQHLGQDGACVFVPALQPQVATHGEERMRSQRVRMDRRRLIGRQPQPRDGLFVMPSERQTVAPFQLRRDDESRVVLRFGRVQGAAGQRAIASSWRCNRLRKNAWVSWSRRRSGYAVASGAAASVKSSGSQGEHCLALAKRPNGRSRALCTRAQAAVDGGNIPVRHGQSPGTPQMLDFRQERLQGRPLLHAVEGVALLRQQATVILDETGPSHVRRLRASSASFCSRNWRSISCSR